MSEQDLIDAGKNVLPIAQLCRLFDVPRSSYYARRRHTPSRRSRQNAALSARVRAVYDQSRTRYGSPRVTRALRADGLRVGKNRVARLMREQSLVARPKRRFRVTTQSEHSHPIAPNLVARNFKASAPNRVWVGDITYVWTCEGWMYLAVLIDLYSRRVVGWAMRPYLTRELTLEALRRAVQLRRPGAGLVHHTDRGSQYASADYREQLASHGMVQSMTRRGNCLDNAPAESFFSTLELELLRTHMFESRAEALWVVADYIDNFYNATRLHSTVGYLSPIDYELSRATKTAA